VSDHSVIFSDTVDAPGLTDAQQQFGLPCAIFSRSAALSVVRSNPFTASWEDSYG
jgi:hypothetical protein